MMVEIGTEQNEEDGIGRAEVRCLSGDVWAEKKDEVMPYICRMSKRQDTSWKGGGGGWGVEETVQV